MNKKKQAHFLFFLGHPAHFHMFRPMMQILMNHQHKLSIIARPKDILIQLLESSGFEFHEVPGGQRKSGYSGILFNLWKKFIFLYRYCQKHKPDCMLGTSAEITWAGKLLKIPSVVFSEDDAAVIPYFAWLAYPFATAVISPEGCNNGRWQYKTTSYPGYQKLAYLHPNHFNADIQNVKKYLNPDKPYSILRFSRLLAHHDGNASGFSNENAAKVIGILLQKGNVFISSERPLEPEFEQFRLNIDPADMHHMLAFASLFAGDSQSMTVEAALLGVPAFRFSSFKGKISVLEELEHRFSLTQAFSPSESETFYATLQDFKFNNATSQQYQQLKQKMLEQKCDVTQFYIDLIFRLLEQNKRP